MNSKSKNLDKQQRFLDLKFLLNVLDMKNISMFARKKFRYIKETGSESVYKVGFSEVPILFDCGFATPQQLWVWKLGIEPRPEVSLQQKIGIYLENGVWTLFCEHFNYKYSLGDIGYQQYFSNGVIHGYLDYYNKKTGEVFEIKVLSNLNKIDAYKLQVNAQLGVSGHEVGYIVYLLCNYKIDRIEVRFDKYLFEKQMERAIKFIEFVEKQTPPPVSFNSLFLNDNINFDNINFKS